MMSNSLFWIILLDVAMCFGLGFLVGGLISIGLRTWNREKNIVLQRALTRREKLLLVLNIYTRAVAWATLFAILDFALNYTIIPSMVYIHSHRRFESWSLAAQRSLGKLLDLTF